MASDNAPSVPSQRLRSAIRLLFPEEMTPMAKRVLESICDEAESAEHEPDNPQGVWCCDDHRRAYFNGTFR